MTKITQWFKTKKEEPEALEIKCGNCQTDYKGHYCPECGQPAKEFDRPFSFVFYDFLGNITAFDSRFYKTFLFLIIKPGFLTKEFFDGKLKLELGVETTINLSEAKILMNQITQGYKELFSSAYEEATDFVLD
ncbi:MAG: DUF3667 domain-containing protein, partial [Mariniphaga sp.]|nr:DUF3667 domain-containing protein [Mariniphaga sp.]